MMVVDELRGCHIPDGTVRPLLALKAITAKNW